MEREDKARLHHGDCNAPMADNKNLVTRQDRQKFDLRSERLQLVFKPEPWRASDFGREQWERASLSSFCCGPRSLDSLSLFSNLLGRWVVDLVPNLAVERLSAADAVAV